MFDSGWSYQVGNANGVANSSGVSVLSFPVPSAQTWVIHGVAVVGGGPCTCNLALNSQGVITTSNTAASDTATGEMLVVGGDTLTATFSGLVPGTATKATIYYLGYGMNANDVPLGASGPILAFGGAGGGSSAPPSSGQIITGQVLATTDPQQTVTVPITPGVQTLLIEVGTFGITAAHLTVSVVGVQSGFAYLAAAGVTPYFPLTAQGMAVYVVPVSSAIDNQVNVTIFDADNPSVTLNVYADTVPRLPSDYFWPYQLLSATATPNNQTLTLLNGPARLFTATLNSTGFATITLNTTSNQILVVNPSGAASCTFPDNTILGAGQKLQCTTTAGLNSTTGAIIYAYP